MQLYSGWPCRSALEENSRPGSCIKTSALERSYLFNVQEVFGFEGDGHALDGDVIAGAGVVAHVCPHCKRHRFGLRGGDRQGVSKGDSKRPQNTSATSDLCLLERGEGLSVRLLPQGLGVLLQGHVRVRRPAGVGVGGALECRSL